MFCRCLAAATVAIAIAYPAVAGPEESLFETAKVIYQTAEDQPPDMQIRTYESVRSILNKIVEDHPASDLAVQIILKDEIEGLDVAKLDEVLAEQDQETEAFQTKTTPKIVPAAPKDEVAAVLPEDIQTLEFSEPTVDAVEPEIQKLILPIGSEATEREISLDKKAIRDLQARLLVIGHDPNGVDGVIGKGTRSALSAWQTSEGLVATGFLNEPQLTFLKGQSQDKLDDWLKNRKNANLYSPPKQTKATSSKPIKSNNSGWYRDSRGMYCKKFNFGSTCQLWKPKALR